MRKDLENYLSQLQKQFNEMEKAVNEANELIRDGKIDSQTAMNVQGWMNKVNENYQRVLYCRYLVNLPPKFIQNLQKKKLEKQMKKFIEKQADEETVVAESQEALDNIVEVVDGNTEEQ